MKFFSHVVSTNRFSEFWVCIYKSESVYVWNNHGWVCKYAISLLKNVDTKLVYIFPFPFFFFFFFFFFFYKKQNKTKIKTNFIM